MYDLLEQLAVATDEYQKSIHQDLNFQFRRAQECQRMMAVEDQAERKEGERQTELRKSYYIFMGLQRATSIALTACVLTWVLFLLVYLPGFAVYAAANGLPGIESMDKASFAQGVLLPGGEVCAAASLVLVSLSLVPGKA